MSIILKNLKLLEQKCKKIKLVLTDVDGVLTDGGMYYSEHGEIMKKFNTRDGMGVELLSKQKIKTIIITRENSKIVKSRGKKIKVFKTYVGVLHKELVLDNICKKLSLTSNNIAYVGDDINDYEIMKKCGLACSPNNCIKKIKSISDYVCENNGGDGVLREVADLILSFHTN